MAVASASLSSSLLETRPLAGELGNVSLGEFSRQLRCWSPGEEVVQAKKALPALQLQGRQF